MCIRDRCPAGWKHRRFPRRGRRDPGGLARHFAARHRRHEARDRQLPHRRVDASARGRVRTARKGEGARPHIRAMPPGGAVGPPPAAAATAEPSVERDQVYAQRSSSDRLSPAARPPAHRRL